ncbi:helix-turn-helix domain-containing protein [Bailinhaonella thermotolerans]|uniref:XRE family transcriptional regulator n=1 Tax=Bailinhaonella thermotolerans TaxID=1070861 RepID=A0A3A4ANC9_9ACTN|nr:helix-turn-helix transcriptional regulator [Bailinhaonella thermotolerans]RJL22828.1 XRE family transcriptional regulator [Bailinhaonella thermotolerans]
MTDHLTIGERIAWYRRRRGMSQEVLAGLVGRTTDWLSKVENDRIELDRLSVIKSLAVALDVALGDLLAEPSLLDWTPDSGDRTVPALRAAITDYRQLAPMLALAQADDPPSLPELRREIADIWNAYQASRYGLVVRRLPALLAEAQHAAIAHEGDQRDQAHALLGQVYHAAATILVKIGEADLAWVAAERGLNFAQNSRDLIVTTSLFRSVAHALLSTGRYEAAVQLTDDAAGLLDKELPHASPELLSVHGTLFLAGSMAAARAEDRATTQAFLAEAEESARRLGADANHVWTAFGPTNVTIHRVATAIELGDLQIALDKGPDLDTRTLPIERRVRHSIAVAQAFSLRNRTDDALDALLQAEHLAPEQVRHHYLSRQLVLTWIRRQRGKPSHRLIDLARRIRVV